MKIKPNVLGLAFAGLGLVLLGGATWILLSDAASGYADQATDFSSIPAQVHFDAPPLTLNDLAGVRHALSDYRGQVVLVNLWATWCPPCEAEMPNLERYYQKHLGDGLVVVAIDDGDPAPQVAAFVAAHGLTFPVWLDPTYQATDRAFKTGSLPTSYVLDRAGTVRWMWYGAINAANLEKYITPLLKE